ncbi:MAG: hypothetical protein OES10_02780 [Gammaproteobacteria bacterium]|nr:hypothetical protein [Gammaproteobacteria bacterium]
MLREFGNTCMPEFWHIITRRIGQADGATDDNMLYQMRREGLSMPPRRMVLSTRI